MKPHLPIAAKFLIIGVGAVMLGVLATSCGFLWRAMVVGRVAQASYLAALSQSLQMELERRHVPADVLSGRTPLPADEIFAVKMRSRTFEVPLGLEQLPIILTIARMEGSENGRGLAESKPVEITEALGDGSTPPSNPNQAAPLRVFGGASVAFDSGLLDAKAGLLTTPSWASASAPLSDKTGSIVGALVLRQPLLQWTNVSTSADVSLPILASLLGIIAAAVGFGWLAIAIRRRLSNLREGFAAMRESKFSYRVPEKGSDDFTMLQRDFNKTMEGLNAILEHRDIVVAESEASKKIAQQATAAKSDFLANMSHEIRTPMNGIIGTASLLLDTGLPEEQEELVKMIRSSGQSLLHLINDILDFSKLESAKMELDEEQIDLEDLFSETIDVFAHRSAEKGLEMNYHIESSTPRFFLADFQRLKQILVNLVGNAVKFTEQGEILMVAKQIWRKAPTGDVPYLHLSVRDTGIGIPDDKKKTIFEAFTQADVSTTRKYGGTGLGLAITKKLANLMQGTIDVTSEMGKGSDFHLEVPLKVAPENEDIRGEERAKEAPLNGSATCLVIGQSTNYELLRNFCQEWQIVTSTLPKDCSPANVQETLSGMRFVIVDVGNADAARAQMVVDACANMRMPVVLLMPLSGKARDKVKLPPKGKHLRVTKPIKRRELLRILWELHTEPGAPKTSGLPPNPGAAFFGTAMPEAAVAQPSMPPVQPPLPGQAMPGVKITPAAPPSPPASAHAQPPPSRPLYGPPPSHHAQQSALPPMPAMPPMPPQAPPAHGSMPGYPPMPAQQPAAALPVMPAPAQAQPGYGYPSQPGYPAAAPQPDPMQQQQQMQQHAAAMLPYLQAAIAAGMSPAMAASMMPGLFPQGFQNGAPAAAPQPQAMPMPQGYAPQQPPAAMPVPPMQQPQAQPAYYQGAPQNTPNRPPEAYQPYPQPQPQPVPQHHQQPQHHAYGPPQVQQPQSYQPQAQPAPAQRPPSGRPTPNGNGHAEQFALEYPARILLVDDQPLNHKIVTLFLQRLGYKNVDIAHNGKDGVEMANRGGYDIIFMDLQMPVMGGVEAAKEIRGNFLLKQQPAIIAMTGHALSGVKESCMEAGMNDFLTKPVSLDDFRRVIPQCLETVGA